MNELLCKMNEITGRRDLLYAGERVVSNEGATVTVWEKDVKGTIVLSLGSTEELVQVLRDSEEGTWHCDVEEKDTLMVKDAFDGDVSFVVNDGDTRSEVILIPDQVAQLIADLLTLLPQEAPTSGCGGSVPLGEEFVCVFDSDDKLYIRRDETDVGLSIHDDGVGTVYLRGEEVLRLIVELAKYTNESEKFDGVLSFTRTQVKTEEVVTEIVV